MYKIKYCDFFFECFISLILRKRQVESMDMDDMAILRPHITKNGNRHYRKLAFEGSLFSNTSDLSTNAGIVCNIIS